MALLSNLELATKNYGRTWTKEMIQGLVRKGKLTTTEYATVVGEPYVQVEPVGSITTLDGLAQENASLRQELADTKLDNLMNMEAITEIYEMMLA